jgi:hypothetical protein
VPGETAGHQRIAETTDVSRAIGQEYTGFAPGTPIADLCDDRWAWAIERTAGFMTEGQRTAPLIRAILVAGVTLGAAFAGVATAAADPMTPTPVPLPSDPAAAAPGQPVSVPVDPAAVAAPALPAPGAPPSVPQLADQTYGSHNSGGGSGVLGSLKDLWHQARDPYYGPDDTAYADGSVAPPPGAGPPPPLPPGFKSYTAPGSEAPPSEFGPGKPPPPGTPALPPGYYSITGPPPPGYEFNGSGQPAPIIATPAPTP